MDEIRTKGRLYVTCLCLLTLEFITAICRSTGEK